MADLQPNGLVCVNGHAMDEGYSECPCCGAYRPSGCLTPGMTATQQMAAIRRAVERERRIEAYNRRSWHPKGQQFLSTGRERAMG